MRSRSLVVAVLLVVAAFGLRAGYVALTPGFAIVHDARDYDWHARSVANGRGFSIGLTGKPTAFRPPGYVYLLGGAYKLTGVQNAAAPQRINVARWLGVLLGTLGVALLGAIAARLWGRRAGLATLALAAVFIPSILVSTALMSEQLFVVFMLGAVLAVLTQERHPYRFAALAGLLAGLAVLTRANGAILLLPLAFAVGPRRAPVLIAVALLTVVPWTIRNEHQLHAFVPVTTQLGWALAGTYNDEARLDRVNPGSWRSVRRVTDYRALAREYPTTPEAVMEQRLRHASLDYIRAHKGYVATVAYWNTRRLLDVASRDWSRHTASTISVTPGWADAGVICFWLFAALALVGVFRARGPAWLWAIPLVMYLSVVFLAAETPRYRAPLDPFVILLAALAVSGRRRLHAQAPAVTPSATPRLRREPAVPRSPAGA